MLQSKLKILLSFFIVYFVALIVVMANGNSYAGRFLQGYFLPVANSIGLNTTWNFFSPDPAHILYIHYLVIFQDSQGAETQPTIDAFFPPTKEFADFGVLKRRDSYVSRFLAIDRDRLEQFFAPWLCRQNPKASRIHAELFIKPIPNLDKSHVFSGDRIEDMTQAAPFNEVDYECHENT